jgi:hypothetical protein
MKNNIGLIFCLIKCGTSEDDIINVEACQDKDDIKLISRSCVVLDCTTIKILVLWIITVQNSTKEPIYEGWNLNSGNYLFTADTK